MGSFFLSNYRNPFLPMHQVKDATHRNDLARVGLEFEGPRAIIFRRWRCVDGRCPLQTAPPALSAADLRVDARAIARIVNQRGAVRSAGTGTLVDMDADGGLVITCAHLFREGTGAVRVTFPNQAPLAARVEKIDADADLAALSIPTTTIEPVTVATAYPRRGDSLVSCGYGGDGRL